MPPDASRQPWIKGAGAVLAAVAAVKLLLHLYAGRQLDKAKETFLAVPPVLPTHGPAVSYGAGSEKGTRRSRFSCRLRARSTVSSGACFCS